MDTTKISLQGVQETLFMPLWGRAYETKKEKPLLRDDEAVRIVDSIDYDFSRVERKVNPLSRVSWIARSVYFDQKIRDFLAANPEGSVINIGCGLDTTYERAQNGKATWYELDFPEVIETRRKLIKESANRKFLPYSAFDPKWPSEIARTESVFVMMAGVIYYFEEKDIKELFACFKSSFAHTEAAFDYSSPKGVGVANKKVIDDGGMDQSAYLKWGIKNIRDIEKWGLGITVDESMKMFRDMKRKYPMGKRLGMTISDALSIMSLAKISIPGE